MSSPEPESRDSLSHRRAIRAALLERGVVAYPYRYVPTHTSAEVVKEFGTRVGPGEEIPDAVRIAGRAMTIRTMGAQTFIDIADQHGTLQASIRRNVVGEESYDSMRDTLDRGDIIGVEGHIIRTRRGELSVHAHRWDLLTKAIRPLPSKEWVTAEGIRRGGLADPELGYRQPELRFIMDPSARDVLVQRARAISTMRSVLERHRYLEVEIPALQPIYGGASARPFETKLHALDDMQLFLSISPELYLKRLVVGGLFDGVYTITKAFRNEGIDRTHNPEFTTMECYKAWWDYADVMRLTEQIWEEVFQAVRGTTRVRYRMPNSPLGEQELDFRTPWRRVRMTDLVAETTGLDIESMDGVELRERATTTRREGRPLLDPDVPDTGWGNLVQALFERWAEGGLIQPTFVIDHPRETTPLCKGHRKDPRLIERFESFVYGVETSNAYSELNDPVVQRQLLEEQSVLSSAGDVEAHRMDEAFCRAIEYGMPPTGGLGIGIDRLVMFLTGADTIRDVIAFPFMRPER